MLFALVAIGLVACVGIAAWVRRPIASGDSGRAEAEATIRAALATINERPALAAVERLAA